MTPELSLFRNVFINYGQVHSSRDKYTLSSAPYCLPRLNCALPWTDIISPSIFFLTISLNFSQSCLFKIYYVETCSLVWEVVLVFCLPLRDLYLTLPCWVVFSALSLSRCAPQPNYNYPHHHPGALSCQSLIWLLALFHIRINNWFRIVTHNLWLILLI